MLSFRVWGLFLLPILGTSTFAQQQQQTLPNAPVPQVKPLALNLGMAERYNFTTGKQQATPSITLDYRFDTKYRVGVSFGHDIQANANTITGFLNYKIGQWGTPKP